MADKKKVMFVDCVSTSLNFIKDAQDENMTAVVLELPWIKKFNPLHYNYTVFGGKEPEIVEASKSYEETLKKVKKVSPVAIIPCSDNGIEWALRLSRDLNLPSSSYENYPRMRNKRVCQKALADFGIRSIETIVYKNYSQALKFFNTHNHEVVVKPAQGTSSVNVFICKNTKELKRSINKCLSPTEGLTSGEILIQEYIGGEEYVVNACLCKGVQKVTSIWKYEKHQVPGFAPVYLNLSFLDLRDPQYQELIHYNSKVLSAIGMAYGSCHNEIKVDQHGPVLIEANCRVPGGSMQGKYLDFVLGHHETNVALWSYVNRKKFMEFKKNYKGCINYGAMKFLVIPKKMYVKRDNFKKCFKNVKSYVYSNFGALFHAKNQWINKTIDYHTVGGVIFLANTDINQLKRDYYYIVDMEQHHLDKLFDIVDNK